MGAENLNPLDELKGLDQQVDLATDLAALKPIFYRLDEIAKQHSSDFEVQLVVGDIKQHLVTRGTRLREQRQAAATPPPPVKPAASGPPPVPPPIPQAELPTVEQALPAGVPPPISSGPPKPPRVVPQSPSPRTRPPEAPGAPFHWRRALILGGLAGSIISIVLIAVLVNQARKYNRVKTAVSVPVAIATTPGGATVRVASGQTTAEATCTSNCQVVLTPGDYQVTAFLDGYQPAASNLTLKAGQPASVNLTLEAQAQTVRILTDLDRGKVAFDDQPAADLQEGQFLLENVTPGTHTVKVTGRNSDASFSFEIAEATLPVVAASITTHDLAAVLVSSLGSQARVVTNAGAAKLVLNGQPQGDAGPAGVDLKDFKPGVDEIVVGEGTERRTMKESFAPAPMLTVFLKSDVNVGTLIVSTGEDDVHVFLNNKEYRRRTQRGQVRVQTIGSVAVRVAKDGFQEEPLQTAEIKKGAELRLEFKLRPMPRVGALQIRGGTPGVEVLLDQKSVGTVGSDGTLTYNTVAPGDRTIELRRDQFTPKRLQRPFRAGQTVVLSGADVVLAASNAVIRVARTPAGATVSYRRADETAAHDFGGNQLELPAGAYIFSSRAPGYLERTERVQVASGETRALEFTLTRDLPPPPPPVVVAGMTDFEDPSAWKKDGDVWVNKGGGFLPYKLPAKGVFTFTVELRKGGSLFRGGRVRWAVQYLEPKNYLLFEIDRKTFWAGVVENGKRLEREKTQIDLDNQKSFTIQIEVTPERLVHKIRKGNDWMLLDSFAEPGRNFTQGKFGFLIQGNDEIGISDFKFTPK